MVGLALKKLQEWCILQLDEIIVADSENLVNLSTVFKKLKVEYLTAFFTMLENTFLRNPCFKITVLERFTFRLSAHITLFILAWKSYLQ